MTPPEVSTRSRSSLLRDPAKPLAADADLDGCRALASAVIERAWLDALSPPPGVGGRPDYAAMRDARDFLMSERVEAWAAGLALDLDALRERLQRLLAEKREQRKRKREAA